MVRERLAQRFAISPQAETLIAAAAKGDVLAVDAVLTNHPELVRVHRRQARDVLGQPAAAHVGRGGLLRALQGVHDVHVAILAHLTVGRSGRARPSR